jgi:tetratricopeptide (TPR) repeat protein
MAGEPGITPKRTSKVKKFTEPGAEGLFHNYLDDAFSKQEVDKCKDSLLDFAARVEMLPIALAVGASLLRDMSALSLSKAVSKLNVSSLSDGVKNVNNLFAQAIDSQPKREQKLLAACAVCVREGFWLPVVAQIAELSEDAADEAANALVRGSLLRVLDRDRRRFQIHALLHEQLRTRAGAEGLAELQERHALALETMFEDWETHWQECRECLSEITPAAEHLHGRRDDDATCRLLLSLAATSDRAWNLAFDDLGWMIAHKGYEFGRRTGELEFALRIMHHQESLWTGMDDPRAKNFLQASYGNQALILQACGRLEEAMALEKKKEAICLELGNKDSLQKTYGNQAVILQACGRLEEAMALEKKKEAICLELGNKDSLQKTYGNQALILAAWGRLEQALDLHKQQEAICRELGNKDGLQMTYGNQANIFYAWGRLEEAMALEKKKEAICLELGNKDGLQVTYGNQAAILQARGRLKKALVLHNKKEAICRELGNKVGLQASYGNQAMILIQQRSLPEAQTLLQKSEAICKEMGLKRDLGYCYWQWAWLARAQGDHATEKHKLTQALALFTELNMSNERDAVQAELESLNSTLAGV